MELISLVVAILSAVISLGSVYAAWRAVRPKPKLRGSITTAWHMPISSGTYDGGLCIGIHIVLTNMSSQAIHVMSYELQAKIRDEWHDTYILRDGNGHSFPTLRVGQWVCELGTEHLLDWPPKPIDHGAPLMGFLVFLLPPQHSNGDIQEYRLTVTDVFGGQDRFVITDREVQEYSENPKPFSLVQAFRYAGVPMREIPGET